MKINRLFSIAAAALMMVACSSEETALKNNPAAGSQMPFTATIAVPGSGAGTRTAYTESGTDINVAWKVGDEIALIHNGVKDVATVKTINSDGSATITGFITKAENEAGVELVYPSALVTSVTSDGNPVFDNDLLERISTQDGTLKYIQDNLDFRRAKGQLSVNETSATLKEAATMNSMHAIWKLTLQDDAETPAALSAKKVSVQLTADVPILRASTAELTTATSTFYLAMEPFTEAPITIEATVGDDTYKYEKKSVSIASGKYYQSTVTMAKIVDLSTVTTATTIEDGYTVTGTLGANVKISIAAGATVTLAGVTINGENNESYGWAGITCLGDATIILEDGTENTVKGFHKNYPGIHVPGDIDPANNKTLTIKGTGSLTASSNGQGAGIGGGYNINCGNIIIEGGTVEATGGVSFAGIGSGGYRSCGNITISGGTVTATGGYGAAGIGSGDSGTCGDITISGGTVMANGGNDGAGIGSGYEGSCGDITISGGTVTATGGQYAAAIGSGDEGSCGNITITTGVTQVTATKVSGFETVGSGSNGSCTNVTIGGTVYWNGSAYQNGGDTYLLKSTIFYPVPDPIALSAVTSSQLGWIVGNDGKAYAVEPLPTGVDAVAKIFYVGNEGEAAPYNHGLALALADEGKLDWSTAGTTCSGKNTSTPITGAKWLLASKDQWDYMMGANGAGSWMNLKDKADLNKDFYWSSSPGSDDEEAKGFDFYGGNWSETLAKTVSRYVRACLAF